MLIMLEGNAAVSAVESIAVIQRMISLFRTILQVPPLASDRRVQIGIYICVYVFALSRDRLSSVLKS